ncbi:MAG: hypothetical protein JO047_02975 [Alphaproteobacteria bacterium]|nr:hypothetical protein [Alphaproteobacteria bacterium]
MRAIIGGVLAAGLAAAGVASAEPCARPAEHAAFDLAALKSALMVTALTCHAEDRYNQFVVRYRADLLKAEHALGAYFVRAHGGQRALDDYITSLANAQSEAGIRLGGTICDQRLAMFDRVMALSSTAELPRFAGTQAIPQPQPLADCPAPARAARTVLASHAHHDRH